MKSKYFTPILISLFSIALTFSFLINNEHAWISVIAISFLCISLTILLLFQNFIFIILFFIVLNHLAFNEGILAFKFAIPATLILLTPLLIFHFKPQNFKPALFQLFLFPLLCCNILNQTFSNQLWMGLRASRISPFFTFVQLFKWNLKNIMQVVSLHLFFLLAYGVVERIFTDIDRIRGPMKSATAYGALLVVVWAIWFSYHLLKKSAI